MNTTRTSKEVRAFNVEQKCGFINCNGSYKSLGLFHDSRASYVHECTKCCELKLFNKEHPYLEYEEAEEEKQPELPSIVGGIDFDDDIPF